MKRKHWLQLSVQQGPHLLLICATLAFAFAETANFSLVPFEQMNHQWWRLLTGHIVHTNTYHMMLNLAGFTILCVAFWRETRWLESSIVLFSIMLGTSVCLGLLSTTPYVGLSSVLHGYLIYLLIRHWRSQPWFHGLLLFFMIIKIIGEQFNLIDLSSTEALIQAPVAIDGHLYGALIGFCLGLFSLRTLPKGQ